MAIRPRTRPISGGPDKQKLTELLQKQPAETLIVLLLKAYDTMTLPERRAVFDAFVEQHQPKDVDVDALWNAVQAFNKASRDGEYYAPFEINWKNCSDIPEETDEWCSRVAELIKKTVRASDQGHHETAIKCFAVLHQLIEDMTEEIVFGDEVGSWMIPIQDEIWLKAWIRSLAASLDPEAFAEKAGILVEYDSGQSFVGKAYSAAMEVASKEQKEKLLAEIKALKIEIPPEGKSGQ